MRTKQKKQKIISVTSSNEWMKRCASQLSKRMEFELMNRNKRGIKGVAECYTTRNPNKWDLTDEMAMPMVQVKMTNIFSFLFAIKIIFFNNNLEICKYVGKCKRIDERCHSKFEKVFMHQLHQMFYIVHLFM